MMVFWLLFSLIGTTIGQTATSHASDLTEPKILAKYTLEMMDAAAVFLQVQVDQGLLPETQRSKVISQVKECSMTLEEANRYLLALQPLMDQQLKATGEKLKASLKSHEKNKKKNATQYHVYQGGKWNQCKSDCRCGLFVSLMEQVLSEELSKKDNTRKLEMQKIAATQDANTILRCGEARTWVCRSDLLRYLKKKAQDLVPDSDL